MRLEGGLQKNQRERQRRLPQFCGHEMRDGFEMSAINGHSSLMIDFSMSGEMVFKKS